MMKSNTEIKDILYTILKESELYREIASRGGNVYTDARPTNSGKEDITILILDSLAGGDSQEFVPNINIYVPDIARDKQMIEDTTRIRHLSRLAIDLFEDCTASEYQFTLESQPVFKVNGADEHCINNRLTFKHLK